MKETGNFIGKQLFEALGVTRQAYSQHFQKIISYKALWDELELKVQLIRSEHPAMGLRTIYTLLKPPEVGRDKFESYFLSKGYRVKKKLTYIKTTRKGGLYWRYKNLMKDRIIKHINQVWVSDITYFLVEGKFYYITLLMDVYSRRIIGYNADKNMYAETTCKTLEMAFKSRKIKNYKGSLIHHSDKGSQYMSQVYLNMLEMHGCKVSVADNAYENSHMERVNGTIKNDYLRHWRIESEEALKKGLARAVRNYNEFKPHAALPEKLPPSKFEESLLHLPAQKLPTVKLYTEESKI